MKKSTVIIEQNPTSAEVKGLKEVSVETENLNEDLITQEPGSHPVSTGIGAAGAGLAGMAIGAFGGPIGAVIGAAIGAVVGGLSGSSVGEAIDPTTETQYWLAYHATQPYANGTDFSEFENAYRSGYEGYNQYGVDGLSFEEAEPYLRETYEATGSLIPWSQARVASHAAWTRVHERTAPRITAPILEKESEFEAVEIVEVVESSPTVTTVGILALPLSSTAPVEPTHEQKAILAERIYREEGCPPGHELEHWLQAERELTTLAAHKFQLEESFV